MIQIQRNVKTDSIEDGFYEREAGWFKQQWPGATTVHMLLIRQGGSNTDGNMEIQYQSPRTGEILMRLITDTERAWKAAGVGTAMETAFLRHGITVKHGPHPDLDKARENKKKRDAIKRSEESETTTSEE